MTIEYEIFMDKKLILAQGSGTVTGNDVIDHLTQLADDDRYTAPMKKLVDYRTIESIRVTSEEAFLIADKKKAYADRFAGERCAFVSPADLSFGKSRVHQALVESSDLNIEVFRNIDEALDWLDVTLVSENKTANQALSRSG